MSLAAIIAHRIAGHLSRRPFNVSLALYQRCCRGMVGATARRRKGILGIAVNDDKDARWWRAWNLAALRQSSHGACGPISNQRPAGGSKIGLRKQVDLGHQKPNFGRATHAEARATTQTPKMGRPADRPEISRVR